MSWQEELLNLDTALAEGKISSQDYRKQREDVLAAAAGASSPSPIATPLRRPVDPGVPANPANNRPYQASPPRQPAPQQQSRPAQPPQLPQRPGTAQHPGPSQRPQLPGPPLPARQPYRGAPPPAFSPPPAAHFEPVTAHPLPYPDIESAIAPSEPRKTNRLYLTLGIVLVLALVAGGVWWFGLRNEPESPVAAPPSSSAVTTSAANPSSTIEASLPELPGTPNPQSSTMTTDRAAELALLSGGDAAILRQNGATEYVWKGSIDGSNTYAIAVASFPDAQQAIQASTELIAAQTAAGLQTGSPLLEQPKLAIMAISTPESAIREVLYAAGNHLIRVTAIQKPLLDDTALTAELTRLTSAMAALFAPN